MGYVGRDVESIIRDLADIAVAMVKEERTIEVEEKAREAAEDRILDILLPLSNETPGSSNNPVNIPGEVEEKRQRTREKFRQQLQSGALDDRLIEVELPKDPGSMMQVFGPMGMEDISSNIQDMFSNMMPKKAQSAKSESQQSQRAAQSG